MPNRSPHCPPIILRRYRPLLLLALALLLAPMIGCVALVGLFDSLLPLVALAALGGVALHTLLRFRTDALELRADSLICRYGAVGARETMMLRQRTVVQVRQSALGRLLDVGDVVLISGAQRVELRQLANIHHLREWYAM
ncbi:MAG TPA: PH domain-containing protein [Kouleothrix sp.]|uniref:PH domain-containing protein n=1 Tax=Kouleothrix sp. TaxID=2779161 RepID=UPI002B7CC647|nr:PH domain-containing protein [Kouleothrix sp.]